MAESMGFDLQDKSAHISSLNKTPASIIQEYAVKNHLVPQYDLIHNGISESLVTFKYSLTLGNYETVGEGSSKKEAKHVAALSLLKKMIKDNPQLLSTEFKQWDFKNHVVSPFDNNIKENAIGRLNGICTNNKIGLPEFKLVREEGQAHAKLFTISCQVAKMIETATHKTKKQAKHLAAVQMVNKLISIDESLITEVESHTSDSLAVMEQVESIKSELTMRKNAPIDEDLYNYHLLFKKSEFTNTDTLSRVVKKYFHDNMLDEKNPRCVLDKIVEECEMQLIEKFIKKELLGKSENHYFTLSINNVYPPIYGLGVNNNIDQAKHMAAVNLLKNMCILFK